MALRVGDVALVGAFDPRHCVAWEGTLTVVTGAGLLFESAILRRFPPFEFCDSCDFGTT